MLFISNEELKPGMRLAKPIYNKNGVLLYERNTKITEQGIYCIKNFGLIGIYVLEPAEPLPPMTEDDIEFEKFQSMSIFMLKDDLDSVVKKKPAKNIDKLVNNIISRYGNLERKITFIQNLRSKEDYTYKHTLNVAILCTLIAKKMNLNLKEKTELIYAAFYHDIGKLMIPKSLQDKATNLTDEERDQIKKCELEGLNYCNYDTKLSQGTKSIIMLYFKEKIKTTYSSNSNTTKASTVGYKILKVANDFDKLTAMSYEKGPSSEISAIRSMLSENEKYDEEVVQALLHSINILIEGTCVELTNTEKGIVLVENKEDVLKPIILQFTTNAILNLNEDKTYKEVQVKDIMKTMDNRYIIDRNLASSYFRKDK